MNLPRYKCHKEVNAIKIAAIELFEDGSAKIAPAKIAGIVKAPIGWKQRFKGDDKDLGYYIVYEDGYASWSPSKAFEDGYTLIE